MVFQIHQISQASILLLRKIFPPTPAKLELFNRDIESRLFSNLCYCQCFSVTCLPEFLLNGSIRLEGFQKIDQLAFGYHLQNSNQQIGL